MAVSNEEITSFIAQTIEIGGYFKVGLDDDKFIYDVRDDGTSKVVEIALNGTDVKPLAVYGTKNPNVYIINPFNEGDATQSLINWYNVSRNAMAGSLIVKIMIRVLEAGVRANSKKAKLEEGDTIASKYLGKYASKIDEKMLKELASLTSKIGDFFTIYYHKKEKLCTVNCLLFKDTAMKLFPSIRKQTWEVLRAVFLSILGIDKIDAFDCRPENPNIPLFETTITVYVNLMEHLEQPAKLIGVDLSDWKNIAKYLKYLDAYYQKARWCTDCVNTMPSQTVNSVPMQPQIPRQPIADVPPAVISSMSRRATTTMPMQPYVSEAIMSDVPPILRQRMVTCAPVPVYAPPVANNMPDDVPPILKQMMGH